MIVNAMGMDLIKRFNILVDYQKQNLYLQPNPAYFKPKKNIFQLSGFKARSPGNKELIVVNMVAGSLAEKAGMKIVQQYNRPVLNRTEKEKGAYSEIIFHLKKQSS
jgi:hypothetical protein